MSLLKNSVKWKRWLLCATLVAGAASLCTVGKPARAGVTPVVTTLVALETRFNHDVVPVLQKHCYACHAAGKHKGDVSLDKYATLLAIQGDRPTWESVCDQVNTGDMPPDDKPRPTKEEIALLTGFVKDALKFRDASQPRDPGRVTIRRLNRAEYNNTIRDLVGVDFKPAADFPLDDTGYGFDNIADVLTMSPLLAEKYLGAAEAIMDRAIVTEQPKPTSTHFDPPTFKLVNGGGTSVEDGAWPMRAAGELSVKFDAAGSGEYEIKVRASGRKAGTELPRMSLRVDDQNLKVIDVSATAEKPEFFTIKTSLRAGPHKISASFVNEFINKNDPAKPVVRKLVIESFDVAGPRLPPNAPLPPATAEERKLLFASPPRDGTDAECAKRVLTKFATRAFRRPVKADELTRMMALFDASRKDGENYDKAVKTAMTAVLVSPHFLFRIELPDATKPDKVQPLDDYALATRLSYFLWSSMPDDALFELAAAGKLRQPGVLDAQVKRMMADAKSAAFVANFAGQWLELRLLDEYEADAKRYPAWNRTLREDMKQEAELFFKSIIKDDGSVLDLLDANYTFLNERMAKFYGVPNVAGETFRKVTMPADLHRGGVLTMAGVLTVTAMPARTSPVKRGKYILEQILGTPPPPPPPDVPALSEKKKDADVASVRARLEQHRADPTCASCHKRMDPIGFALENYDAIGHWRDKEGTFAIDASGVLPGNKKVDGPAGLKKVLLERKDDFTRCLAGKMLTYAIGRGIEPGDRPIVEDVCDDVRKNNYKFSSLLVGIVKSDAFEKRRAE